MDSLSDLGLRKVSLPLQVSKGLGQFEGAAYFNDKSEIVPGHFRDESVAVKVLEQVKESLSACNAR